MDPKELVKLYQQKQEATAAETAKWKAELEKRQEEFRKRAEKGGAAMRDVVIPYLNEVAKEFPKGHFKINPALAREAESLAPVAVSFKIGDGPEHVIEVNQGIVRIYQQGPQIPAQPGRAAAKGRKRVPDLPGFNIRFVYSGNQEPFIAGPDDLTRGKLAKLVEIAIKKE